MMDLASKTTQERAKMAVQSLKENPNQKLATVAKKFHITRGMLRRRVDGVPASGGPVQRHTLLNKAEEIGLCRYIDYLDDTNIPIRKEFVVEAANAILRRRHSANSDSPLQVGKCWVNRFIKRKKFSIITQKTRDKNRQAAEDITIISRYFDKLQKVIANHGVDPADIWNMDETGFQIGVGKNKLVITRRAKRTSYLGVPTNRESATAVEAISTTGEYTPAFLILSGKVHLKQWYNMPELAGDTVIAVSDSGYSNDVLSLDWLRHFDQHTKKKSKGKYRLLILDGYGSHHTFEFVTYAEQNDIILFGLPPHLTHLLQPLDVVVFQPLKHWHSQAIDLLVRDGVEQITKVEFLQIIQDVRKKAFKESTIRSAFEKTGIWPFNPAIIIDHIKELHPREVTPPLQPTASNGSKSPASQLFSSPFRTPQTQRQFNVAARYAINSAEKLPDTPDLLGKLQYHVRGLAEGAEALAVEHTQLLERLRRVEDTIKASKQRKNERRSYLQHGGTLSVMSARKIAKSKEDIYNEKLRKRNERLARRQEKEQQNKENQEKMC